MLRLERSPEEVRRYVGHDLTSVPETKAKRNGLAGWRARYFARNFQLSSRGAPRRSSPTWTVVPGFEEPPPSSANVSSARVTGLPSSVTIVSPFRSPRDE